MSGLVVFQFTNYIYVVVRKFSSYICGDITNLQPTVALVLTMNYKCVLRSDHKWLTCGYDKTLWRPPLNALYHIATHTAPCIEDLHIKNTNTPTLQEMYQPLVKMCSMFTDSYQKLKKVYCKCLAL